MFIVPHGAPEGYEWFVALVVLVGLYFAVRNFMRAHPPSPPKYLKKARPLDGLQRDRPRPTEERHVMVENSRQAGKQTAERFGRLCESIEDLPPKEQASRLGEYFGIVGGARPAEGRGRKGKRPEGVNRPSAAHNGGDKQIFGAK